MFSPTEIVTLVIQLAALPFVITMLHSSGIPGRRLFGVAYGFLLLSNLFTVAEDVAWNAGFNHLEHLSMAAFALVLLRAVWVFLRDHPWDNA